MLYTIENEKLKVVIASLGATITKFIDKASNTDMVLGFDDEEGYLNHKSIYLGATIGRVANRIGNGRFELNGVTYSTPVNDTINTLHGGEGFAYKQFEVKDKTDTSITLEIFSKDGEDGFPGNLTVEVKYELKDNKLRISYNSKSDKDTILSITNHSYFNLDNSNNDALDHEMLIYTDRVALLDGNGLSTALTKKVDGTPFDFREFRTLRNNFEIAEKNMSGGGIDHNFVYENLEAKDMITIRNSKLAVTVSSDMPDCQIYTSNFLGDVTGKDGKEYHKHWAVAIEPQYYPNAINYSEFIKPIIKANTLDSHFIEYTVESR